MDKDIRKLSRTFTFERAAANEEERTVEFSFSSEFPVERRNGQEVLSHRAGDYDFSHLNSSAPLLLGHDQSRQVGKVVSACVRDGVGYAKVQFSRGQEGTEVFQDMLDGIRTKVSVGYFASSPTLERNNGETPTYRYKWAPYEVSLVAISADPTVGFGRDADPSIEIETPTELTDTSTRSANMSEKITAEDVIASIEATQTETRSAEVVEQVTRGAKPADVEAICRHFGFIEDAADLVARSATIEEVQTHVQAKWKEASKSTRSIAAPTFIKNLNQPKEFSKARAFRAAASGDWDEAGYEKEISQERSKHASRGWDKNIVILEANETVNTRAALVGNAAGVSSFGSNLVGTEYRPEKLIDVLWNQTFLDKVGVDSFLGLQGNQSIPVINTNAVSTWVAETGALPTEQRLGTATKTLSPKELVSKFAYSRQLLIQGLPNIEEKILGQLYQSIGQALDAAAISNTGITLSTTGLLNEITQIVALGTNGAAPTLKTFTDLRKLLVASKVDPDVAKLVLTGALREALATTLKDSGNTNSGYILSEGTNTIRGNQVVWSQNVPSNLTKGTGTNLSAAILGKWDDFAVAQWGNIAVEFDPISAADYSQIVIRSYSFWDMAIKRLESFAIVKDVIA